MEPERTDEVKEWEWEFHRKYPNHFNMTATDFADQVVSLYEKNISIHQIAVELGSLYVTVYKIIDHYKAKKFSEFYRELHSQYNFGNYPEQNLFWRRRGRYFPV